MVLKVLGFYSGFDERTKGYRYLRQYGCLLDEVAFFRVAIRNNGELFGAPSRHLINEIHKMGIKVLLTISNLTSQGHFSTELISRLVRDKEFSGQVWQAIRNMMAVYKFDGINLDLEKGVPGDRKLFTEFIRFWTIRFKQENFLISLDVPAKIADESGDIREGVFDYKALGKIADQIVIMSYEEHWPGSQPGSIASFPWVKQVLDYALESIPATKIFISIPLYGYDWNGSGRAKVVSFERANQIARRFGAPLKWDSQQHSTYFTYQVRDQKHTVYFEDLLSIKEKLDLAVAKGIGGIAVWQMNLSFNQFWEVLRPYV
ncbi:MAG: glycosyl hydrolase family 18 protein [Desulfitobacteriaceae bacterium]|nr:glycosyl hydrolase family 18 protein [Desulfitobacteriaceae bacterium]MDD4347233.1 glycosyl hydrolase family 18 protein [Desulfitobacteriaceae bacterium]MDD4401128.1 glycosyl hydrolase family 18 protein [Desulfitobacteriaceae bacterium]